MFLMNQMLQQKPASATSLANDLAYSPDDFSQILNNMDLDAADFTAYGKFLPVSEMNEGTLIDRAGPMQSAPEGSMPSQVFSFGNTAASTTSLNTAPQDIQVDLPVGQPKWGGEFAQKVVWLTSQQNQVAEIHLNPAHLGPVDVMLSITQDQATAQFLSPHLAVREAIEQALPRLREMMAENGIQLGNVMVGADSFQQENKQQQAYSPAKGTADMNDAGSKAIDQIKTTALSNRHNGIVNTYA
jgi:flagellar hook-length control protein FliK